MGTAKGALMVMPMEEDVSLFGAREVAPYNEDERLFSEELQARLDRLLHGQANELPLLRYYAGQPSRLGVIPTPPSIDVSNLRLRIVDDMVRDVVTLLHDGSPGGPRTQRRGPNNRIVETQSFTTKFAHILLIRTDVYDASTGRPLETVWSARRVQNQLAQIKMNRTLDLAILGFELIKTVII